MFSLAICCLTTQFTLLYGPNIPHSYAVLFFSIRFYFHHSSHPQLGTVLALAPSLHSFQSYFSTLVQQHFGHLPTWGVHLSVSYVFAFYTVHGVLKARILQWFAIPFFSRPCFIRTLHYEPFILGGPTWHGLVSLSQTRLWSL